MTSKSGKRFCGCYEEQFEHGDGRYALIKEQIGFSYIKALGSFLELEVKERSRSADNEGIDLSITGLQSRFKGFRNTKPCIDVQLKCTSAPKYNSSGDMLVLKDLNVEIYRNMLEPAASPLILMILVMPDDVESWVNIDENGLLIPREMLWYSGAGTNLRIGEDQKTVSVSIPIQNRVTKESIIDMMLKVANTDEIRNEI